jgi:hypothetical protein
MALAVSLTALGVGTPLALDMLAALLLQLRPAIHSLLLYRLLHRLEARVAGVKPEGLEKQLVYGLALSSRRPGGSLAKGGRERLVSG